MKRFTVAQAEIRFDELLDMSEVEAVMIETVGGDEAVLLSKLEYDRLMAQTARDDLIRSLHEESIQVYNAAYRGLAKN